jgi:hypothetical protein
LDEVLGAILRRCDVEPPVFAADEVAWWPDGLCQMAVDLGILAPAPAALTLPCDGCGGDHQGEVVYLTDRRTGQAQAWLPCPECGPSPVDPRRLRRWRVDAPALVRHTRASLALPERAMEIVAGRLWRLGTFRWGARRRSVFLGRLLYRHDVHDILGKAGVTPRSIVFTPYRAVPGVMSGGAGPQLTPLSRVASWDADGVHLDREIVEAELADVPSDVPKARPARKRAGRAADIEALSAEMREHLRAARRHALATLDQTGQPQLLPRPTQEQLARRVGRSQHTVSRCLRDQTANELQYLWDLAIDLDRVLRGTG